MKSPFGPWTTSIHACSKVELSALWKRRMAMLVAVRQASPSAGVRTLVALAVAGLLIAAVPTWRHAPATSGGQEEVRNAAAVNDRAELRRIASLLQRQDGAWDDLFVKYRWELWVPAAPSESDDARGPGRLRRLQFMEWQVTRRGWERVQRLTPAPFAPATAGDQRIEEASFNGTHYMTFSSQNAGSGSIGRQPMHFLNISESPKSFGIFVTGLEIGHPMTLSECLLSDDADARHARGAADRGTGDPGSQHRR
jgi:hypothetical protein